MLLIHVTGDVIGVGFRATTREFALQLGLKGYVRNLPNGSVEIGLDASRASADQLVNRLKQADFTRIDEVSVSENSKSTGCSSFDIRY